MSTSTSSKVDVVRSPRAFNFFGHKNALLLFFSVLVILEGTYRFVSTTWNADNYPSPPDTPNPVDPNANFRWATLSVAGAFEWFMGLFGLALAGSALLGYSVSSGAAFTLFGLIILFGLYITAVWVFYYPSFITDNVENLFADVSDFRGMNAAGMLAGFGYQWMLFGGQAVFAWAVARAVEGKVWRSASYRGLAIAFNFLLTWTGVWLIVMSSIIISQFEGTTSVQPILMPPLLVTFPGLVLWMGIQTTLLGLIGLIITGIDYESRENSMPLWVFPIMMFFNFLCQHVVLVLVPFIYHNVASGSTLLTLLIIALNFLPGYLTILERRSASNMFFFESVDKTRVSSTA